MPRAPGGRRRSDPFLTSLYERLHDAPMQRKFRKIAPIPVGVVFQQRPGMTMAEIRREFRLMKKLGFTCLKQCLVVPGTDKKQVMHAALDEGIIPWWYDEGGWEAITPALLRRLRIPVGTPTGRIRANRRFLAYQMKVMRRRIDRGDEPDKGGLPAGEAEGRNVTADHLLDDDTIPRFMEWVRKTYKTADRAMETWFNRPAPAGALPDVTPTGWEDIRNRVAAKRLGGVMFVRDVLRFKADLHGGRLKATAQAWHRHDPDAPFRAGGETSVFLPHAARGLDMEGIADVMADYGSFYPSIHLSWHFEEVDFEVTRPVFMIAQMMHDWFKGGWSAAWESTGGPQQFDGGKAPFWEPARGRVAGFTVDGGVMTQLMLSYLAGGFKGFGFWCWSGPSGLREYSLLDRQRRPCDRTVQAGRIGRAARRFRDELWAARKEPLVGVLVDWDSDAIWAARAVASRDLFKHVPMKARVGASRALINANVPWEYVTACDLRAGLAERYRVIYLPAMLAVGPDLMRILHGYVRRGGRVVLDMPGAIVDNLGRSLDTDTGSLFERTFGCMIRDYQYSSNVPRHLAGRRLSGWVADLGVTTAAVRAGFDSGAPAVTEGRPGKGSGVLLGWDASLMCFAPGDSAAERLLVAHALGAHRSPYSCEAIVYRLASPVADHYFLINDGPARVVKLATPSFRYRSLLDAVSGERVLTQDSIALPAYSGRWVRAERG
jgi:beta-galactosidase